eukprot:6673569-Ditylum_brightwellii.AAC.1
MLQQPDREEFELAEYKDVKHIFDKKVWEKAPQSEMMAYYNTLRITGINVKKKQLVLNWSSKWKRHAHGSLAKYKARLYCPGSQQQWGVNYYETYAPVVSWPAVRIMMIMSKLYTIHTEAIDFVLAYPQAELKTPIYLLPPAGV